MNKSEYVPQTSLEKLDIGESSPTLWKTVCHRIGNLSVGQGIILSDVIGTLPSVFTTPIEERNARFREIRAIGAIVPQHTAAVENPAENALAKKVQ